MDWNRIGENLVSAVLFGAVGLVLFAIAMKIIVKVSPFSIRKEMEEDQNVALGVLLGSIFVGLALILAAAVHG